MIFKRISIVWAIIFAAVISQAVQLPLAKARPLSEKAPELIESFVYYADSDWTVLKSEKRKFPSLLGHHDLGVQILKALFEGPSQPELNAAWPKETRLNALFITDAGLAVVDIDPPENMAQQMDTSSEMLAVYSLVNSLALNLPTVKQVKILVNGNETHTLAGHIGLKDTYKPNMLIVK